MTTQNNYWIPAGDLSLSQAVALSVQTRTKPDWDLYRDLLTDKLNTLIAQLPRQEAKDLMTGSWEHQPNAYAIATEQPIKDWGIALAYSDSVMILSNRIDWKQPGTLKSLPPQNLAEFLEQIP